MADTLAGWQIQLPTNSAIGSADLPYVGHPPDTGTSQVRNSSSFRTRDELNSASSCFAGPVRGRLYSEPEELAYSFFFFISINVKTDLCLFFTKLRIQIQDFQMGRKLTHQTRKPSFFKVLLCGFKKQLRIPTEFIKHVNGKLPGKFNLRSPNGTWWLVKVKKIKDGWFFHKGWNRFVKYHSLKVGEFLVFSYRGNSKFRVTIFDRSTCEKVIPLEEHKISHIETEEPVSEAIIQSTKTVVKSREKKRKRAFKIKINGKLEAVRLLETEHPHFTQILRSNLRYQITIPRALAVESGLVGKKRILLWDPQGRSWPVNLRSRGDGRLVMRIGWGDFWKENNLVEGDACVFEFLQQGTRDDPIFVHIFRAAAEILEPISPDLTANVHGNRALASPGRQEVQLLD
ncbi:hypothetical protein NE237_017095 [Protea cynaroides]|uniref:TF-B3 domain-containing protein n=1 Tax=Protea cynaroides TaxID=273540 RepID=A0A9Q0K7D3_9MAGN|nr:hypothetical protein NE237_017095 [Protea cynaroides]